MALTDTFVKKVKFRCKGAGDKYTDGGGMYLLVNAAGKYWRLNYRFQGKQKTLALGVYPAVSLAKARGRRDEARELLADGVDPSAHKRVAKQLKVEAAGNTFEVVAREFHATASAGWSEGYAAKWLRGMEKDLFPYLGNRPLTTIATPELLDTLRRVERRGAIETTHTLRQTAGQVFQYGLQTGRCERNPVGDLKGALKPVVVRHYPALLDPEKVGGLLRAIEGYGGQPVTRAALGLSALLLLRPGNIRKMEWPWVDFDRAMLTIPSIDMKRRLHQKANGRPHLVPLAPQALAYLRELKLLTGHGRFVFPSLRTGERPMSDNTVNAALRRMGLSGDEMTAHGFRAMARTVIIERIHGIQEGVIEAQLSHGKSGPLGMAYDRAEFLDQRREMMNVWANYLDRLRAGDYSPLVQVRRPRLVAVERTA